MAPKRKAPAANGRATKRVASGVSTPVSIDSDDEYTGSEAYEMSERENEASTHKYDSEWWPSRPACCSLVCVRALTKYRTY